MNKAITIISGCLLGGVLIYGLSHAWMVVGILKFIFIIAAFVGVGYVCGRLHRT